MVWADQLCINQNDLQERSAQVGMMSLIYVEASLVLVILDCNEENKKVGNEVAALVESVTMKINSQSEKFGSLNDIPKLQSDEFQSYDSFPWLALNAMLTSPWFKRAWVVQEVGLAGRAIIRYGHSQIEWDSLMLLIAWLSAASGGDIRRKYRLSGWTVHHIWVSYKATTRKKTTSFPSYSFIDILSHNACTFKATNPRDHIYAFLGHPSYTKIHGSSLIDPQYDWSVNKVYLDFATKWLQRIQQPYLFSGVDHDTLPSTLAESTLGLPSWCPRWDSLPNGGSRFDTELEDSWYRASKESRFQFSQVKPGVLKVSGFVFDTITTGFRYEDLPETNFSLGQRMSDIYQKLLTKRKETKMVYEEVLEAFAATTTAGFCGEDHAINCLAYMNAASQDSHGHASQEGDADRFSDHSAETTTARRRLFITSKGYLGMGAKALADGDVCCILFGSKVPYILRPLEDSTYFLVGESYVHGIMLGEAMDMCFEKEFVESEFVLR